MTSNISGTNYYTPEPSFAPTLSHSTTADILQRNKPTLNSFGRQDIITEPAQVISQTIIPTGEPHVVSAQQQYIEAPLEIPNNISNIHHLNESRISARPETSGSVGRQVDMIYSAQYGGGSFASVTQNHSYFENWDNKNKMFITDRINVTEDLLASMNRKVAHFEEFSHRVVEFFKERERAESHYARAIKHGHVYGLPKLRTFHEKNNDEQYYLGQFATALGELDEFETYDRQKSETLCMYIKQNILELILVTNERQYKEQAKSIRTTLRNYKKQFDFANKKSNSAYNKYYKNYSNSQKSMKMDLHEHELLRRQLKYSLRAKEDVRIMRAYNEQVMITVNEFGKLCKHMMNEIKRAFMLYWMKYIELYPPSEPTMRTIMQEVDEFDTDFAIDNMFMPVHMLQHINYEVITRQCGKQDLDYQDLSNYLINFHESQDPARTSFVVNEWHVIKKGGVFNREKPCMLLATSDNSLFVVPKQREESEMGAVKMPLQMQYTMITNGFSNGNASGNGLTSIVSITEKVPNGGVFHHNPKATLQFENPSEAQDFINFINSRSQVNSIVSPNLANSNIVNTSNVPVQQQYPVRTSTVVTHIPNRASTYQVNNNRASLQEIPMTTSTIPKTTSTIPMTTSTIPATTSTLPQILERRPGQRAPVNRNVLPERNISVEQVPLDIPETNTSNILPSNYAEGQVISTQVISQVPLTNDQLAGLQEGQVVSTQVVRQEPITQYVRSQNRAELSPLVVDSPIERGQVPKSIYGRNNLRREVDRMDIAAENVVDYA